MVVFFSSMELVYILFSFHAKGVLFSILTLKMWQHPLKIRVDPVSQLMSYIPLKTSVAYLFQFCFARD